MKKAITYLFVFIFLINSALAIEHYYEIELSYDRGSLSYGYITVNPHEGDKINNIKGDYLAEIVSFKGETLNYTVFGIPTTVAYDKFNPETGYSEWGGVLELNETETIIRLPYFDNAKEINIYNENATKRLTIDVSPYSRMAGQDTLEEEILPEERIGKEEPDERGADTTLIIGVLAIVIILALIIFLRFRKRKNQ